MTYKESLTAAMTELGRDPKVRFVGYGLLHGRAGGTLRDVPEKQIVETPVAENLMMGIAIGLSLCGLRPVVYIERMDFILNALDAIVNHLDKMEEMSRGEFNPAIILRVVVGNHTKPLYTGATHTQNFSDAIQKMVSFPVVQLGPNSDILEEYKFAYSMLFEEQMDPTVSSTMLVEFKDLI